MAFISLTTLLNISRHVTVIINGFQAFTRGTVDGINLSQCVLLHFVTFVAFWMVNSQRSFSRSGRPVNAGWEDTTSTAPIKYYNVVEQHENPQTSKLHLVTRIINLCLFHYSFSLHTLLSWVLPRAKRVISAIGNFADKSEQSCGSQGSPAASGIVKVLMDSPDNCHGSTLYLFLIPIRGEGPFGT